MNKFIPFTIPDKKYCEKVRATTAMAVGCRIKIVDQLYIKAKISPIRL